MLAEEHAAGALPGASDGEQQVLGRDPRVSERACLVVGLREERQRESIGLGDHDSPSRRGRAGLTCEFSAAPTRRTARVVIAVDVETDEVRRLVGRYFGALPRGRPAATPAARPVTLPAERRLVLTDGRAQLPERLVRWRTAR